MKLKRLTRRLPSLLEREVRRRAGDTCEYCRLPQLACRLPFEIEHIIPRKHHGTDASENLCLACPYCNRYKGSNIAGIDPLTGQMARLFNPRTDQWQGHFRWKGAFLDGLTPLGRTTIAVLEINHPSQIAIRNVLMREGAFPPG